ncbi:MAG: EAL domain-containing protein [Alphaproteobacteria bacterium]|nr:EAL domain-containing protein [Alphaproteobacteria bacterium]
MRSAAIALAVIVFVCGAYLGLDKTINWLLWKDASSIGMNWAHHMDAHLPSFMDHNAGHESNKPDYASDAEELEHFAFDILSIEQIYQIDFINAEGQKVASFGDFTASRQQARSILGNSIAPGTIGTGLQNAEHSANPGDTHAHTAQIRHGDAHSHPVAEQSLPLDQGLVAPILNQGLNEIVIRRDSPPNQPTVFAEVYHPIKSGGQTICLLRVLIDLEGRASLYRDIFTFGSILFLIAVTLFGVLPLRKFLQIRRGKFEADGKAQFLATHDLMTGVTNRNAFQDRAPVILAECAANGDASVLFLIDIDGFKDINDFYGHDAGDQLLKQVAGALEKSFPDRSLIARMGGDEFAVLAPTNEPGSEARYLDIPKTFGINLNQRIQKLEITITAGMARFPRDGKSLEALMQNADLAWYSAKKSSSHGIIEFDHSLRRQFQTRIDLLRDFSRALEAGQIVPHYQALICSATGRVRGFEALARWQHPTKGLLTPGHFFEALEDRQIAQSLGAYMLNAIATDMAIWKSQGVKFETIGLNVTDADLLRPGFSLDVIAVLSRHGLTGKELAIELTENCLFGGDKKVIASKLTELRSAGCHIALDDFGTGYSSITHIKEMPVTAVKIDMSFIREIANDPADQAIVRALVDLGEAIGFKLVAEGVETEEQHLLVEELGCHLIQGYYHARPVPAEDVPGVIAALDHNTARLAG